MPKQKTRHRHAADYGSPALKATKRPKEDLAHGTAVATAPFELREDGTIAADQPGEKGVPELIFHDQSAGIRLYHGDCFQLLDKIAEKHPEGYADMIFADPLYFLSNGGITCHAGKMVKSLS